MAQDLANIDPSASNEGIGSAHVDTIIDVTHFGPELLVFNIFQLIGLIGSLFFNISSTLSGKSIGGSRYWRIILVVTPYAIFIFVVIESTIIALASPNAKFSSISYCSLENHVPGRITSALDIIFVLPILVLNFLIYLRFRKHRSMLRAGNFNSMFIRVSVFVLFGVISVAIGLLFFVVAFLNEENSNSGLVELDIVLSMIPVAAVVIFGTHKDLLVVWLFWRKKHNNSMAPVIPQETKPVMLPSAVHIDYVVNIERDYDSSLRSF
ncbi:hypothetical protein BDP27DRAFT_1407050 [Rhodocollybia butyracea]|uniref:Uncharacterized protein n=1 Tax=Rhodocollybia butyracea TaxID=206335 RepID=A0A9P5TZ81_9AGAR|nr:hypothetical protein BDP27DRAFT_1407050 [Rhodocollybia butyracea]